MKKCREITPLFYSKFKCIGDKCLSTCCRGWTISIDKKTYKKYKSTHKIEIKEIAEKYLTKHPQDGINRQYSFIALNENGYCPFFSKDKLCGIYKSLGPGAMSQTCQEYPRIESKFYGYTQYSLTFSCPEVVRLVLFDPESMKYKERTTIKNVKIMGNTDTDVDRRKLITQENQIVQLFFRNLIMAESPFIEDNLYALTEFIFFLKLIDYKTEENYIRVENFFTCLVKELTDGNIYKRRKSISTAARIHLKISLLLIMINIFKEPQPQSRSCLNNELGKIINFFDLESESFADNLQNNFKILDSEWKKIISKGCLSEPGTLKNYFLYLIYHEKFGLFNLDNSLKDLYYYLVGFFHIKTLLSVKAICDLDINQEDVQLIFSHYTTKTMHSADFRKNINEAIEKINYGNDLSCLLLLN